MSDTVAGEPMSQLCFAQYSGVTSESGTDASCLRYSVKPKAASSGRKYSVIMRPIMPPAERRSASASVSATKTSRTIRQSDRWACGLTPGRALLHRVPVARDIARVQIEAHRPEPALARQLERVRALAEPGHTDGRVRLLERDDVRPERIEHRPGLGDVPVFALVVEFRLVAPQAQDDVERLARHVAVLARHAVHVEQGPVARQPARGHPEVEPALGQVVEHGHAIGQLGRVVVRHQEAAGPDAHALGLHQRLGHQQVRRGMRLPGRGVVLPDPGLAEAQLVRPAKLLEIPLVPVEERPLGRVRRHREETIVHDVPPGSLWEKAAAGAGDRAAAGAASAPPAAPPRRSESRRAE